jgi:tetratricopeptide (TPR) repeat protein
MEFLWLLAVLLVPLAFLDRDYVVSEAVISYVEVPKIALLRTLAGLMAVLWLVEWGAQGWFPSLALSGAQTHLLRPGAWLGRLASWLRERPTRWVIVAAWFFLGTTLLSTILSASVSVSLWGEVPGQDGYPAYTVVAYLILFGVIATHLRTRPQLWRLLGAIVLMGLLVAGNAIFQHYGHDFLDLTETTGGGARRVTSFMGNAIFSAAVMMMTIPITLAVAVISLRERPAIAGATGKEVGQWAMDLAISGAWGLVLAVQLLGLTFTFSRGPWIGGIFSLGAFLVLALVFVGWRFVLRAGLILVLSLAFILAVLIWQGSVPALSPSPWLGLLFAMAGLLWVAAVLAPWRSMRHIALGLGVIAALAVAVLLAVIWFRGDAGVPDGGPTSPPPIAGPTAADVAERFSSIKGEVLGGFIGGRGTHWKVSWQLIRDHPWFDSDGLSFSWLRPLIGYGPDLFRFTYLLRSPAEGRDLFPLEPDHAHNFFIHQTVEQGYLGLLSSLGVFAAVFLVGGYQLFRTRHRYSDGVRIILIVLVAILAGRFLEMMVGVARVSDLTILWVLLAVFAALPMIGHGLQSQVGQSSGPPLSSRPARRAGNRPRPRSQQAAGGYKWRLFWRLAIVVWLIGGIATLTWVKSINYVRAAVEEADGLKHFRQGDLQSTLESLDRATNLAPDVSHYYNNLSNVYLAYQINKNVPPEQGCSRQKKLPYNVCLAARGFQSNLEGVKRQPLYYRSRLALANSAYNLPGLKDKAARFYRESLALVPNSWPIRNDLADAYIEAGRPEEAVKVLEESLAITGDTGYSTMALFLRGKAYEKLGNSEESVSSLERSLKLGLSGEPAKQAFRVLAKYYMSSGQAGSYEPQSGDAYFSRGLAYSGLGQYERAIEDYTQAIERSRGHFYLGSPQFFEYFFNRGLAYFNLGRYGDATTDLSFAIGEFPHPDRAEAFIIRGIAYGELGRAELAIQDLAQNEAAIEDLEPGFRLNPRAANVYYARGLAYFHLGQYQRAITLFDEATRLEPRDAAAYAKRGVAYGALGQQDRAIQDLNEARRLGCSC